MTDKANGRPKDDQDAAGERLAWGDGQVKVTPPPDDEGRS